MLRAGWLLGADLLLAHGAYGEDLLLAGERGLRLLEGRHGHAQRRPALVGLGVGVDDLLKKKPNRPASSLVNVYNSHFFVPLDTIKQFNNFLLFFLSFFL